MSLDLTVTGGVGGVAASFEDMHAAAVVLAGEGDALDALGRWALRLHEDHDLIASALLCPGGAFAAQAQLLAAVAGPHGLVAAVVDIRLTSLRFEAAADLYVACEKALAELLMTRRYFAGRCIAVAAGPVVEAAGGLTVAIVAVKNAAASEREAGVSVGAAEPVAAGVGDLLPGPVLDLLEDHPFVVDELVGTLPGVISGLFVADPAAARDYTRETGRFPYPRNIQEAAGMLIPYLRVGRGRAVPVPAGAVSGSAALEWAPSRLADTIGAVQRRSDESKSARVPGLIGVRELPASGRRPRAWVVELPGTQVWNLTSGPNPLDLATNVQAVAGSTTAYRQAVASALRGKIPRGEPVLLVGHSQGGLTAAALAADPKVREQVNITHVVTAGSPVAGIDVSPDVQVLSLENERDLVGHMDATENAPTTGHTTVVFDAPATGAESDHGLDAYRAGAGAVDASPDPSVRAFLDGADVFLRADAPAVLHRFQLIRDPAIGIPG